MRITPSRPVLCLIAACMLLMSGMAAAVEDAANSSKECSMCHFRWLDDFLSKEKKNFLVTFPEDRVVAWEMMCYSCHDGSIADSRFRVWETNKHKAGVRPSAAVTIPNDYPLDPEGRMQCGTCHSAHGVDTRVDMASAIFLREPNVNSSMCQRCHQDKDTGPVEGNHPINVEFQGFSQEILDAGGKAGENRTVICESCHAPHGSTNEDFLVIPNSETSLTQSMLCETCHTLSPDMNSDQVLRRHSHPVDVEITADAHLPEQWDNGETPRLGKGDRINCRTCHSPHKGTKDNSLLVQKNRDDPLCLTCHSSKERIYGTKHDIAKFYPQEPNAEDIQAGQRGTCNACHFMHKGYGPKMWARKSSAGSLDEQCFSCHSKDRMAEQARIGRYSHPVGVTPETGTRPDTLPLFTEQGKRDSSGRVSCASCHDVHRWSPDSEERGGKDATANANNSFLRQAAAGESQLCNQCHRDQSAIRGSEHDMSLTAPQYRNIKKQTLEQSGICSACHIVHNAVDEKLWARKPGAGQDYIEGLCATCHAKGHLAEKKIVGQNSHPLGDRPSELKKSLPLYTKEGKKSRNGGVACASCHDVHRWQAGLAKGPGKQDIEGDRFSSFLRLPNDDSASLCAACHETNAQIIGTDHDLRITAPEEQNLNQERVSETGVCGTCHVVHNAWGNNLWARGVGTGENRNEALCTGCHARKKSADKKALSGPKHPMNIGPSEAKDTLKRETAGFYASDAAKVLPLFDKQGSRSETGDITCSTCHNPHRWDPEGPAPVTLKNLEGNGSNSFLRKSNGSDSSLCTSCHTEKAFVLNTEHDMMTTAPGEQNALKQTVAQSGVCSACHVPHDAPLGDYQLWARDFGDGSEYLSERVCLSCHAANKVAANKEVKDFSHPPSIFVAERAHRQDEEYAPLYNADGRKADAGIITCPTCHDPHNWAPGKHRYGPGINEEGNSRNSFLRFKSGKNVCRNCHGLDSLSRYKYYHSTTMREKGWAKDRRF